MGELLEPACSLSDTKLFKYRTYELLLSVPKTWRERRRLSEMAIIRAGVAAKVCRVGSSEPLKCPKCGRIVLIHANRTANDFLLEGAHRSVEQYTFSVRSHCTSSRDHLKSSLVLLIDLPGTKGPLCTEPFVIHARVKPAKELPKKGDEASVQRSRSTSPPESEDVEESPAEHASVSPIFKAALARLGPLCGGSAVALSMILPAPPVSETRTLGPAPTPVGCARMIVHFVKIDMEPASFDRLLDGWELIVRRELGPGYVGQSRRYLNGNLAYVVETFSLIFDAVRGLSLCAQYTANAVPNVYLSDLTGLVSHLSISTSW